MKQKTTFKFKPFSRKQRQILNWWTKESPVKDCDGIIADGSIRSGKSLCMSLSFCLWAMSSFNGQSFGMCGKSISSFRRNVLFWLKLMLTGRGYRYEDKRSDNLLIIYKGDTINYFYIFGGRDERSQDFVQGITLAGVFLDEVALMPESFVNQATGRCSVDGSKLWFNCNPSFPSHWFKTQWIDKRKEKNLLYLHFMMDDNLSLSERVKERYKHMYSGVFFKRYILGLWALAEGLIYPMYEKVFEKPQDNKVSEYCVACDYGTMNAFACMIWEKHGKTWYGMSEYYYSGREQGVTKTDTEYADEIDVWLDEYFKKKNAARPERLLFIIDPSAASFISLLYKRKKYKVLKADNNVVDGIHATATAMQLDLIKVHPDCKNWKKEVEGYVWDEKSGDDRPIKENDHAMDLTRYFVKTKHILKQRSEYKSLWN